MAEQLTSEEGVCASWDRALHPAPQTCGNGAAKLQWEVFSSLGMLLGQEGRQGELGWLWGVVGVSQGEETHPHTFPLDVSPAGVPRALVWLFAEPLLGLSHSVVPRCGLGWSFGRTEMGIVRADVSL